MKRERSGADNRSNKRVFLLSAPLEQDSHTQSRRVGLRNFVYLGLFRARTDESFDRPASILFSRNNATGFGFVPYSHMRTAAYQMAYQFPERISGRSESIIDVSLQAVISLHKKIERWSAKEFF